MENKYVHFLKMKPNLALTRLVALKACPLASFPVSLAMLALSLDEGDKMSGRTGRLGNRGRDTCGRWGWIESQRCTLSRVGKKSSCTLIRSHGG